MGILNKITTFVALLLIIVMQFVFIPLPKAYAYSNPATVNLGTVINFAALAHTTITTPISGTVLNNGDLGTDSSCTGFPSPCLAPGNGVIINGQIQYRNGIATTGQTDATAAVTNIGLRTVNATLLAQLGGQTLTQGVYEVPAAGTNLTGDLTLNGDANSVFIFHLTSTLITDGGSRVLLTGGAQACNVFWKVDSSATFNGSSIFVGTVLASASVTFPGGGATLNGRAVAQTAEITFNNTQVNNSSCASASSSSSSSTSSSSSSSSSSSTTGVAGPCIATQITTVPVIIESKRISPTSIFVSWGPYTGINTFNVRYGLANGNWLYSTSVTGFSTTLNALPANQPIWIEVAATNSCAIGTYGASKLVGGPSLPNTGFAPHENNVPWIPAGISVAIPILLVLIQRKNNFLSKS